MDAWAAWNSQQYALLDFGQGRKLERLGGVLLDRPCPAAMGFEKHKQVLWKHVDLRLDDRGQLSAGTLPKADWLCRFGDIHFKLKLTPFGHVGVFPEQIQSWNWLRTFVKQQQPLPGVNLTSGNDASAIKALNLFAYTGGTTLALASAGAQVVHVDASSPAVAWARDNALASGMQQLPVRWIVEDARKFVARELRRGNRYDLIVMDPPSYGHGPTGKPWEIASELPSLINDCLQLLRSDVRAGFLLTGHSTMPSAEEIAAMLSDRASQIMDEHFKIERGRLWLQDGAGRKLDSGYFVRCTDASDYESE